jgi:cytochrome c peroxidase
MDESTNVTVVPPALDFRLLFCLLPHLSERRAEHACAGGTTMKLTVLSFRATFQCSPRAAAAILFLCCVTLVVAQSPFPAANSALPPALRHRNPKGDTPEALLGERLFLETRFAQYFAAHQPDVNAALLQGDPVMETVINPQAGVPYPGPFAGKSMNCRACHFVEEFTRYIAGSQRSYTDYGPRSMIPGRGDGRTTTLRNTRSLVDALSADPDILLLHSDGEFNSAEDITRSTLTGRTFGWLLTEHNQAVSHIARVIREDNGTDTLGRQYGGPYAKLLLGTAPDIAPPFRLPEKYRLDVRTASDQQIVQRVSELISAYLASLEFERLDAQHTGSAYDRFLVKNHLPAQPAPGETAADYTRRLARAVDALASPSFVKPYERYLRTHSHVAEFGQLELRGLTIFLRQADAPAAHTGNCAHCHQPPEFTDYRFHNTGAAQEEFDAVHGAGSFVALRVPSLEERRLHPAMYLPATLSHPDATGVFRTAPSPGNPKAVDLGLWNVYANPDYPAPQPKLQKLLCQNQPCDTASVLASTIALFRTSDLRDLGHSDPYLHTGRKLTIEDVLHFYQHMSALARQGKLRNGDPALSAIDIDDDDVAALAAFLRSLDEDYDN